MRWIPTLFAIALLAGCSDAAELEKIRQQRDGYRGKVAELKQDLESARAQIERLNRELGMAQRTKAVSSEAKVAASMAQLKLTDGQQIAANLTTSLGDIRCELWPAIAPETVLNFVGLAEGTKEWTDPSGQKTMEKLYDGTKFHRVIKGFMLQGGDPLGNGRGGPGFRFGDEVSPEVGFDRPGLLAMANSGSNTNGSQFFITDSKPTHLNQKHTIFGECDLPTVRKILAVETTGPQGSTPAKDVILEKVVIVRG